MDDSTATRLRLSRGSRSELPIILLPPSLKQRHHSARLPEEAAPHMKGFMFVNCRKAVTAGLCFRPLSDTIKDTLTWHETNRVDEALIAGIDSDREQRLLKRHDTC